MTPPYVFTEDEVRKEAEDFLHVCVRAARAMIRLNDMQLAHDLLVEAMLWAFEYQRSLEGEVLKDIQTDPKRRPLSTIEAFRR